VRGQSSKLVKVKANPSPPDEIISTMDEVNTKRSASPAASTQPTKRPKHPLKSDEDGVSLPFEMWAAVMDHLDFSSVLSLCATSRIMRQAESLVTELHIHKSHQMHGSLGRRFRDVRVIFVYCFATPAPTRIGVFGTEERPYRLDAETCIRVVPFLSNNFSNLKRVCFGSFGIGEEHKAIPFVKYNKFLQEDSASQTKCMNQLIDTFSAAFRCGTLSSSLEVKGLRCPLSGYKSEHQACPVCDRAVMSFPPQSVVVFECEGDSYERTEMNRTHNLDVCLDKFDVVSALSLVFFFHNFSSVLNDICFLLKVAYASV
jgi:hypothetical protein